MEVKQIAEDRKQMMSQIILIGRPSNSLAKQLVGELHGAILVDPKDLSDTYAGASYVYLSHSADRDGMTPDLLEAARVFQFASENGGGKFVLISSALIYGTGPNRPPFVDESYRAPGNTSGSIRECWDSLESSATTQLGSTSKLTILRLSLVEGSSAFPARLFARRLVPTLPGHDPVLQLLSLKDLAQAVRCVISQQKPGTFNLAPDTVVPLHKAVRLAHSTRIPVPRTLSRLLRRAETLEYLRYSWTISNHKIKSELGFIPNQSSAAAFKQKRNGSHLANELTFDEFGMDKDYIKFYGKTLFKFMSEFYWRIEDKGLEYIPASGRGVLVGMHRGFMPFDGVMAMHTIVKKTGRYPRFLTHPGLLKFPFLAVALPKSSPKPCEFIGKVFFNSSI